MAEEKKVFLPDIIDSNKPGEKFEIKNFDEIKEALASILAEFKDFKLTDNYAEAKDLRARLNNAAKALNAKKIAVKKAYLEPYEYGENQVKALIEMIAQASDSIDVQIKEYEENMKKKKEDREKQIEGDKMKKRRKEEERLRKEDKKMKIEEENQKQKKEEERKKKKEEDKEKKKEKEKKPKKIEKEEKKK